MESLPVVGTVVDRLSERCRLASGRQPDDGVAGNVAEQQRALLRPDGPFGEPEAGGNLLNQGAGRHERVEAWIKLYDPGFSRRLSAPPAWIPTRLRRCLRLTALLCRDGLGVQERERRAHRTKGTVARLTIDSLLA